MEAMGSPTMSHNMTCVAAQAMFYIVAGSQRIQTLNEMEIVHAGCGNRVTELEQRILELTGELQHA